MYERYKNKEKRKKYLKKYILEHKEERKKYLLKHKKEIQEYKKEYRQNHKKEIKLYNKKYKQEHREEIKEYEQRNKAKRMVRYRKWINQKRKTNLKYHIGHSMETAICISLRGKKAGRKWEILIGYTVEDLIRHLESQFNKNMDWDNYGNYWEIDHKKPQSLFNYICPEDKEFKECWALNNLQPLEKKENRQKSNKYCL